VSTGSQGFTGGFRRAIVLAAASTILIQGGLQPPAAMAANSPTIAQLVGQKLMVLMSGTTADADLLGRIQRGEIGGVILFGSNISSAAQLNALTTTLRNAAAAGGQPPLLIATDQEGGAVKRLSWAPPTLSPPQMGALGSASTASSQGRSTGVMLGCAGVNDNLAPVADVPASTSSFMYQQGRTWSFSASATATLSDAFAVGLRAGGDLATMKHFPGIGMATLNTDQYVVTITASRSALAPGLMPYQVAIEHGIPMVMLSNATYTAYDAANGAGWSHAISVGLLRDTLGFTGVSITDSLDGTAAARGVSVTSLAIKASIAGTDMILLTSGESSSKSTFASLVQAAWDGTIPLSTLQTSYNRIAAMKAAMAAPVHDTAAPTEQAPVSNLYAATRIGGTTTPVVVSWSASDPCGISDYVLERQVNGGSWSSQALPGGTSTSIRQSLVFGATYRYVVKAADGAGNMTGWAYGPSFKPLLTQQSGVGVTYHGTWTSVLNHPYASGGSLAYSTTSGASATFRFSGYSVSWIAYRGPNRGSAAVYLDGVYRATVNLYSSTYVSTPVAYAAHWSGNGTHTITIVNLGTSGHPRVDVDAFVRLTAV
jgi:beta-N-acetylhexosaminidase